MDEKYTVFMFDIRNFLYFFKYTHTKNKENVTVLKYKLGLLQSFTTLNS
jgi:hypothetical protein